MVRELLAVTPYPVFSALALIAIAMAALYLARTHAHHVITTVCGAFTEMLKLAAQAATAGEQRLSARNREVLLAAGREAKERIIEREFDRIIERLTTFEVEHWADHTLTGPSTVRRDATGSGFYFRSPEGHLLEVLTYSS